MARPTKLTAETHAAIVNAIKTGAPYKDAAGAAGVDYATFNNWMIAGEKASSGRFFEFFQAVSRAKHTARLNYVKVIARAANDGDWSVVTRDDGELVQIDWQQWRRDDGRGQEGGRPLVYAVAPDGSLCFGPVPDAAYAVSGEYWRGVQTLALDADVPDMPEDYHMAIVWKGLMLLGAHDETIETVAYGQNNFIATFSALTRNQMGDMTVNRAGALA